MRLSARQLQHQQQVEQHAQQAPHQERHQWRCWPRQLRGAHGAFSRARRAHSFSLDVVSYLIGSRSESCHKHLHTIRGAPSLTRFSLSTSTCSSLSFPSTSCTPSCTLSSTTRSSWKACATPPTRRVRTPTTSPPPSQVKSSTSWPSASSTTHRFPSPSRSRHRTKTWMTYHSASCSQRHTEDKPITANQKACQSASRRRLLCSMEQGNLREKEMSINQLVLVSRDTRTVLTASFLKTPKLRKWSIDKGNLRSEKAQMRQIRTLLEEQRQMIIAEYRDKSRSSRTPNSSRRRRAPTSARTIMATEIGISWSSSTKSYRYEGITKIPKF